MKEKCDNRIFLVSSNVSNIPLAVSTSGYFSRTVVPAAHAEQETSRAFSREYLNRIRRFTTEIAGREGGESKRETLFPLPGCVRRLHTVYRVRERGRETEGERERERIALPHFGARVSARDEDVVPTDNPPSTYLSRAPLTRRTPWHDRCSAGGVGIRGWPRGGDRDSVYP